jgi:hypothetical protein
VLRRKHHLTPDEVAAWRDGELDDPALEGHVLSCKSCQASLAEARLTRHLIRASQSKPVGEHIAPSEIGEYFDALFLGEWMGEERIRAIGAHLDSCSACL